MPISSAPSATARHVLEADGIRLTLGNRVLLSDVYLRVQTGQIVGFLGRNGCGKSTLLQTVFGARAVADASVRANGQRVVPAYRRPGLLNYLPQAPLLPPQLTLAAAGRLLGVDAAAALHNFPELLAQQHQPAGELSGGTGRLAEVLLLLHADTHFTLLDEPFTGVMPVHTEALAAVMRRVTLRKGLLLTDHRYEEVLALCDAVYLLHNGCLERLANPREGLRDRGYLSG